MKKKVLSLLLAVVMLLALAIVPASAAGSEPAILVLAQPQLTGVSVAFAGTAKDQLTVAFTGAANTHYSILMVRANLKEDGTLADTDPYTIGVDTILYIDQQSDAAGAVSCTVYPSSITNSVILVGGAGLDKPVALATVKVPYKMGDLNEDGDVKVSDLLILRQYLAHNITLDGNKLLAADLNKDGSVKVSDLLILRQYLAHNISSLD